MPINSRRPEGIYGNPREFGKISRGRSPREIFPNSRGFPYIHEGQGNLSAYSRKKPEYLTNFFLQVIFNLGGISGEIFPREYLVECKYTEVEISAQLTQWQVFKAGRACFLDAEVRVPASPFFLYFPSQQRRFLARALDRDLDQDLGRALVLDQISKKLNLGVNIQPDIPQGIFHQIFPVFEDSL